LVCFFSGQASGASLYEAALQAVIVDFLFPILLVALQKERAHLYILLCYLFWERAHAVIAVFACRRLAPFFRSSPLPN